MEKEFNQLKNFLDSHNIRYKVYEHAPVFTSEQAASVRGFDLKGGVKALVFRVQKENGNELVLALVSGDRKIDTKKLSSVLHAKDVHLAAPQEVLKKTGCEIGSVHPFGNLAGLDTYMDKRILENRIIAFNAGLHTISITMKSEDFANLLKPKIADIAK